MRAPISVVIPTHNRAGHLPGTLASLAEGLDAGLIRELVIADSGSTDGTQRLADAAGADLVKGALSEGISAAQGVWLMILAPMARLSFGWSAGVLSHLGAQTDRAAYFPIDPQGTSFQTRLLANFANIRTRLTGAVALKQGLLIPRADATNLKLLPNGLFRNLADRRPIALPGRVLLG